VSTLEYEVPSRPAISVSPMDLVVSDPNGRASCDCSDNFTRY
jgi:hypothetical protein